MSGQHYVLPDGRTLTPFFEGAMIPGGVKAAYFFDDVGCHYYRVRSDGTREWWQGFGQWAPTHSEQPGRSV